MNTTFPAAEAANVEAYELLDAETTDAELDLAPPQEGDDQPADYTIKRVGDGRYGGIFDGLWEVLTLGVHHGYRRSFESAVEWIAELEEDRHLWDRPGEPWYPNAGDAFVGHDAKEG